MIGVALSTRDLVKRYGRRRALDGFTLAVPRGAMMGLVGANGAGKTTWMMAVAGFLRLTSGSIDLLGRGPFDAAIHSGRFTILPQDSDLPLEARPGDLLYRYARMQGLSAEAARRSSADLLAAVNLSDRAR
jgi:ABC-2 type transport system ATP-binding protein